MSTVTTYTPTTLPHTIWYITWQHRGSSRVSRESNPVKVQSLCNRFAGLELAWDADYGCWRNVKPLGTLLCFRIFVKGE